MWILPRIVCAGFAAVNSPDLSELAETVKRLPIEVQGDFYARFLDEPEWVRVRQCDGSSDGAGARPRDAVLDRP